MIQRRVVVSGRVQGVGFRAATLREANQVEGLLGWVRNLSDGRVEAVFAGDEAQVLKLVAWIHSGPAHAQVSRLEVFEEPFDELLVPFEIRL